MKKAIENNKFTDEGLKDVIDWINMAECYKTEAPVKEPKSSPEYWKYLTVESLMEQLIEMDDSRADWESCYYDEIGISDFSDVFMLALASWGQREMVCRRELTWDGKEMHYKSNHLVLK